MSEMTDLEHRAEQTYTSFAKREPAVLAHLLAGPLAGAFTFLITHGVISATQASQATQWISTSGVTAAIVVQGFLVRRFVAPAWKVAEHQLEHVAGSLGGVSFEDAIATELTTEAHPEPADYQMTAAPAELTQPDSKPALSPAPVAAPASAVVE